MRRAWATALSRASEPVDGASLRLFRAGFGVLVAVALVRLHLTGWTAPLFLEPTWRFRYDAFLWVPVIPNAAVPWALAAGAVGALGLGFARGVFRRLTGALFIACFAWLKLADVTNYLNHDYLAVLLALLLTALPLDGPSVPRWALWLVRLQVAVVYVHAGLAKVQTDWLLHAQPLETWFAANRGLPGLGPLLALPLAAWIASWAACLYDLTIALWLSLPRARAVAFAAVLTFHGLTHVLFDIGLFPFIMTLAATAFFEPSWPRRVGGRPALPPLVARPLTTPVAVLAVSFALFQVLFPLRSHLVGDDVLWDEQGMRWSWKVLVREKNGAVSYRVRPVGQLREWRVAPTDLLTPRQANEMSGQPDLIVQLARKVGADFEERIKAPVEVFVDAVVSLNGRPPARLFREDVDVTRLADIRAALLPSPRGKAPSTALAQGARAR